MNTRHLMSIYDLSAKEIEKIINIAFTMKKNRKKFSDVLNGKTLGLIFEKPSTRTMTSFAAGMVQLGGSPIILNYQNLQINRGETIHDTSLVFSSYLDALMIRAFEHDCLEEFAKYSHIPIINGLTDKEHPCQVLGDIMTLMELFKIKNVQNLKKLKIVFCGEGNNVANSLIAASSLLGLNFTIISPHKYFPRKELLDKAQKKYGAKTKAIINVSDNIESIKNADAVYTDVWTSMGFEKEEKERKKAFQPYQVNADLLKKASNKVIVLHCLPARRGEEITDDIMSRYEFSIFMQAENRLHIQKSILLFLLK